jgi:hypothetical protein
MYVHRPHGYWLCVAGNSTTDESTSPNDEEAGSSMNKIKASNANADLNNQVVDVDKQNDSDSDKEAAKADAVPAEQLSSVKPLGPCPLWKENKKGYIMWWLNKTILRGINQVLSPQLDLKYCLES